SVSPLAKAVLRAGVLAFDGAIRWHGLPCSPVAVHFGYLPPGAMAQGMGFSDAALRLDRASIVPLYWVLRSIGQAERLLPIEFESDPLRRRCRRSPPGRHIQRY